MSDHSHSQEEIGLRREPAGERGRRRRELILDTAAEMLVKEGPEGLNTNALAARAGIAVCSVYQYFANKEAILLALGQRYLEQMAENTVAALQQDLSGLSMQEMVDRVVTPMIDFERSNPAFGHFTLGPEAGMAEGARRVDQEILTAIHALLLRVRPGLEDADAWNIARVTKALYKGMSYLIHEEGDIPGPNLDASLDELKQVMAGYLEGRLGERVILMGAQ